MVPIAVTAKLFGGFLSSLANKEINLNADTFKVMLCTSSYVPDQDTHRYKSDVTNEITGTGYTAGGATLGSVTVGYTAGTNTLKFDAADTSWSGSTLTARYAVVYDATPGTDSTRPLVCYGDFGADVSTTAGTFTITWDSAGLIAITAA